MVEHPPRQRKIAQRTHPEDRPRAQVAEIADMLDISVSAATSNMQKARTNLAAALGDSNG